MNNYSNSTYGFATGMGAGTIVITLAICIYGVVCMWRIFEKAGEPGWKSLIPIYNMYMFYKIAWDGVYFFLPIIGTVIVSLISALGARADSSTLSGIGGFLMIILYVIIAVIAIIADVKLAKRFGKSTGFAVGLVLLSLIFYGILAFDSSDYDRNRA